MELFQKVGLLREGWKKIVSQNLKKNLQHVLKKVFVLLFSICAQNDWILHSIDIKTAFLHGNLLSREIFINTPPEAGCLSILTWKLNKCIYRFCDASLK